MAAVLARDDERYVAITLGAGSLLRAQLHVVPWQRVIAVDHETLAVRLDASASELAIAPQLDPARAVEGKPAEARRCTDVVPEPERLYDQTGPVDRTIPLAASIAAGFLGLLSLLAVIAVGSTGVAGIYWLLLLVPALLLGVSALAVYRLYREPTEPRASGMAMSGTRPRASRARGASDPRGKGDLD